MCDIIGQLLQSTFTWYAGDIDERWLLGVHTPWAGNMRASQGKCFKDCNRHIIVGNPGSLLIVFTRLQSVGKMAAITTAILREYKLRTDGSLFL